MRRLFFWMTILSGAGAAYLMFKRGAPIQDIAKNTLTHPVGTLTNELKAL